MSRVVCPLADVGPQSGLNQSNSTSGDDESRCGLHQSNLDVGPHNGVGLALFQNTTNIGADGFGGGNLRNLFQTL